MTISHKFINLVSFFTSLLTIKKMTLLIDQSIVWHKKSGLCLDIFYCLSLKCSYGCITGSIQITIDSARKKKVYSSWSLPMSNVNRSWSKYLPTYYSTTHMYSIENWYIEQQYIYIYMYICMFFQEKKRTNDQNTGCRTCAVYIQCSKHSIPLYRWRKL